MRFSDLIDEIDAFSKRHRALFLSSLSFQAAELANSMPVDKFLAFILEEGGKRTYVAQIGKANGRLNTETRIARALGEDAVAVAKEYGGIHHVFPSPNSIIRSVRKFLVYDRYGAGQSINQITAAFGLNERTIRRDIAAARSMLPKGARRKSGLAVQETGQSRRHKPAKSQSGHIHSSKG